MIFDPTSWPSEASCFLFSFFQTGCASQRVEKEDVSCLMWIIITLLDSYGRVCVNRTGRDALVVVVVCAARKTQINC